MAVSVRTGEVVAWLEAGGTRLAWSGGVVHEVGGMGFEQPGHGQVATYMPKFTTEDWDGGGAQVARRVVMLRETTRRPLV